MPAHLVLWAARQCKQAPQVVPGAFIVRRALYLLSYIQQFLVQQILQAAIVGQGVLQQQVQLWLLSVTMSEAGSWKITLYYQHAQTVTARMGTSCSDDSCSPASDLLPHK